MTATPSDPSRFSYLRSIASLYGTDEVQVKHEQDRIIAELTGADLAALSNAYREIERRGDVTELSLFAQRAPKEQARPYLMLLFLFGGLADRGVQPFMSRTVRLLDHSPPLDWSKLPDQLAYLIAPAEKYGKYRFDEEVYDFLNCMSDDEHQELLDLAERMSPDWDAIDAFQKEFRMTKHPESAHVYFLCHLLALMHDVEGS